MLLPDFQSVPKDSIINKGIGRAKSSYRDQLVGISLNSASLCNELELDIDEASLMADRYRP